MSVAFVLGGGGHLGAHEVGMLRALLERGIVPDLVLGTSVGAINGAAVAAEPAPRAVERLTELWTAIEREGVFGGGLLTRLGTLARSRTHLHDDAELRGMLRAELPVERIEDLAVPFQCVAASIERAAEHWFTEGPLVDAIVASASVPGILPPARVGGEHFLDGGIVNSIPVGRAAQLGATEIYVLHVGRIERGLEPPRWPWEVALVAFEIARRHRFHHDLAGLPEGVRAHVMPTGQQEPPRPADLAQQLRYRDTSGIADKIDRAYAASLAYLEGGA